MPLFSSDEIQITAQFDGAGKAAFGTRFAARFAASSLQKIAEMLPDFISTFTARKDVRFRPF